MRKRAKREKKDARQMPTGIIAFARLRCGCVSKVLIFDHKAS